MLPGTAHGLPLTSLWRASNVLPSNCGETISTSNAAPQLQCQGKAGTWVGHAVHWVNRAGRSRPPASCQRHPPAPTSTPRMGLSCPPLNCYPYPPEVSTTFC